jgi:phage-related protein
MPATEVYYYREGTSIPVLEWLLELSRKGDTKKAVGKLRVLIELLKTCGHELRRPHADILRDEIHELRARHRNVQYRMLYFFAGKNAAILAHAIIKTGAAVPDSAIELARQRKAAYQKDPKQHRYEEDVDND